MRKKNSKTITKSLKHKIRKTWTGSWEALSLGPEDCPDTSDATDIIRSLKIRGRQLVGCLKNSLDSSFNVDNEKRKLRIEKHLNKADHKLN